jgi:LuxR family maltose regulon positive regulatory protein
VMVLQAVALQADGDQDGAVQLLGDALALAEPGGFIRLFVDEGPPMAQLLYRAAVRGMMPDYTAKLLAAFEDATKDRSTGQAAETAPPSSVVRRPSSPALSKAEGLVEPLSPRELEVLQLVAEGLTNPEIAARLYLSLNTIKVHTRNIYGKLGVNNRTKAVTRARALGVLPAT